MNKCQNITLENYSHLDQVYIFKAFFSFFFKINDSKIKVHCDSKHSCLCYVQCMCNIVGISYNYT